MRNKRTSSLITGIFSLLAITFSVNQFESHNKMSLNNLATVFGPTMIRPGANSVGSTLADQFTAGTIDVMAQAGILYFFLQSKVNASETAC